jgi:hypothetical protein
VASEVSPEHVAMLLEMKPEVVSFHFGLPEPAVVEAIKSAGIFILSSATTVAEARILEGRGVDAVIAQGTEAGGHRATFSGVDIAMQPGLFALFAAGRRRGEGAGDRRRRNRRRPHRGGGLCARRQRRAAGHRLYALRGSQHV